MRLKRLLLLFIVILLSSCSRDEAGVNYLPNEKVEVLIGTTTSSNAATRAYLDENYNFLWNKDDEITLFSQNGKVGDLNYVYDSNTNDENLFSGEISSMEEGSYTYYLNYPKADNISGTTITHNIPAEQDGTLNCDYDLMWGSGTGGAITANMAEYLTLPFTNHLMHIIRFEVPEDRNTFGSQITKMEVTFSEDVVGDISYDYASSSVPATSISSNGSKTVTLNLSGDNTLGVDGNYAYMFINPTNFINATIDIVVYSKDGKFSKVKTSEPFTLNMEAGKITPLTFTPEGIKLATTINLNLPDANNNLGENITAVTLTAPTDATFKDGLNSITLDWENGEKQFVIEEDQYSNFKEKSISLVYKSANTSGLSSSIKYNSFNTSEAEIITTNISIPYLAENSGFNFSATSSNGSFSSSVTYTQAEKSLSILGKINEGKKVNVDISFDAYWKKDACSTMKIKCKIGSKTSETALTANTKKTIQFKTTSIDITKGSSLKWVTNVSGGEDGWLSSHSSTETVTISNIKIKIAE